MRRFAGPPAVIRTTGRTRLLALALWALWLPGAVAAVAMAGLSLRAGSLTLSDALLLGAGVGLSAVLAFRFWRAQEVRALIWDGADWSIDENRGAVPAPVRVSVRADLQHALLLRCTRIERRAACWLWAERAGADDAGWHLFRCALQAGAQKQASETDLASI